MYAHTVTIIVPVAIVAVANMVAKAFDPDTGGARTFGAVQLSATGLPPATHTACNTASRDEFADVCRTVKDGPTLYALTSAVYADRWAGDAAPTEQECSDFIMQAVIVVNQSWAQVFMDNGLMVANEEMQ